MQRTLLVFALLACGLQAAGQASPLPIDSTTHKVTYTAVVAAPGATQAELYSRAREWFATSFTSGKAVLDMDDRAAGKLIGKAYAQFDFASGLGKPLPWTMWRTIKVEARDGRYRYTITDLLMGGPLSNPAATTTAIEPWLAAFHVRGKSYGKSAGNMEASVLEGVASTCQQEAQSLQAAMTKPGGKDW